jgi:hypothetical protein
MDKESEISSQDNQQSDEDRNKSQTRVHVTRSSTRLKNFSNNKRRTPAKGENPDDSHHNSPISHSASRNGSNSSKAKARGNKKSKRIRRKSKKVIEAESSARDNISYEARSRESKNFRTTTVKKSQPKPKPMASQNPKINHLSSIQGTNKNSQMSQKQMPKSFSETSEVEIPENVEDLFNVFRNFIIDLNEEASDLGEQRSPNCNLQQYYSQAPSYRIPNSQTQHEAIFGNQEEMFQQQLQNMENEQQIQALLQHLAPYLQNYYSNDETPITPQDEINRNERIVENLSALQYENLENNLNYSMENQQFNQLFALLLSECLERSPEALTEFLSRIGPLNQLLQNQMM